LADTKLKKYREEKWREKKETHNKREESERERCVSADYHTHTPCIAKTALPRSAKHI
jgi:hypothetical protein